MRASCLIRQAPHYRRHAFARGLERAGFRVGADALPDPRPGDVAVIWNRYGTGEEVARRFEKAGAAVLVCENGYLGRDAEGRQFYAIARNQHNGAGRWAEGGAERWERLGIALAPWRGAGTHILVCPSRGIGPAGVAMPFGWEDQVLRELRRFTKRPIRVRPHPNDKKPRIELDEDLRDCWAVVVWNSAAGVHALVRGVPVFSCAPHWVVKPAASGALAGVDNPPLPERRPAFERLAWAQWSVDEIESGEPFRHLLPHAEQVESRAAV